MQISTLPAPTRTAPPSVDNASADAAGGDFAKALQQQAEPVAPDAAGDEGADTPAPASREPRPRAPGRPMARPTERPAAPDAGAKAEAADETSAASIPASESAPDRSLLDWLAALHLPAPAMPAADASTAAAASSAQPASAGADTQPLAAITPEARPLAGAVDSGAAPQGPAAQRAGARDRAIGARGATAMPEATEPASTRAAAESGERRRFSIEGLANIRSSSPAPEPTPLAVNPAPTGATPQNNAVNAPAAVPLATPLDDPQFPRAFGVQVSVLARDGVQQAELHLNPAEMGPVSVQIVMDGTQARIDFGADAAGTRQLIEHSLPDLAAALREAGLTLTGGGVSQHPSGRDAGDGRNAPADPQRDASATPAESPAAPLRRTVRAGGVDLYA